MLKSLNPINSDANKVYSARHQSPIAKCNDDTDQYYSNLIVSPPIADQTRKTSEIEASITAGVLIH